MKPVWAIIVGLFTDYVYVGAKMTSVHHCSKALILAKMQKYISSAKMVDLLNTLHESRRLKTNSIANLNRRIQP